MSTQQLIREYRKRARIAGKSFEFEPVSRGIAVTCDGQRVILPHTSRTVRKAKVFSKILGL